MGAQKLKHEALLMEWREKVAECRGSGKGVKEWRRLHQVSLTSYYRWERELLLKAEQQLAINPGQSEPPAFVGVRAAVQETPFSLEMESGVVARPHTKMGLVDICAGADKRTPQNLLWVLKAAE